MANRLIVNQHRCRIAVVCAIETSEEDTRLTAHAGSCGKVTAASANFGTRLCRVIDDVNPFMLLIELICRRTNLGSHCVYAEECVARQTMRGKVTTLARERANISLIHLFRTGIISNTLCGNGLWV